MPACLYEFLDPDSNRIPNYFSLCVWIRIRTVIHIILCTVCLDPDSNRFPFYSFHFVFGSGFEPLSKLFSHTLCQNPDSNRFSFYPFTVALDPDSNRYPNYSFHYEVWIRIRTVFQTGVSFKSLFCYHIKPAHILNHMYEFFM